jgi:hypothetical protein
MISINLASIEFYNWNEFVVIQTSWAYRFYNVSYFSIEYSWHSCQSFDGFL